MLHSHIGVPKFIERGFSLNEKAYVYDIIRNKDYIMPIDRLGTTNNYYENDVEKNILANGIEAEFSKFYNDFCNANNPQQMFKLLSINNHLVQQFFSFMFMRAKKTLVDVNDNSLSSKLFGNLNHSDLLRIQLELNTNPLKIVGDKYKMYPLVNLSNQLFINNSIGFALMVSSNNEYSFVIPLNIRVGILISGIIDTNVDLYYIEKNEDEKADRINKSICKLEKEYGNGFIFGSNKDDIIKYRQYIEKTLLMS